MNNGRYSWIVLLIFSMASALSVHADQIHEAVSARDRLLVGRILLRTPEAAKATKSKGVTPLHMAAALDYSEIAGLLIKYGADVNARTTGGFTPLHWAASKDSKTTALLLLEKGADPFIKAKDGVTALDWAIKKDSDKTAHVIMIALMSPQKIVAELEKPVEPVKPADLKLKAQGKAQSRINSDIDKSGFGEALKSLDTLVRVEGKMEIQEAGAMIFLSGDLRSKIFDLDKDSEDPEAKLREAYCEARGEEYAFSLGRQIMTWGKLDEVVILDRISPQDYDWFVLNDKMDRKLPVTMFRGEYFGQNIQVEALFMPQFDPAEIRYFGTDWSFFGHMKEAISGGYYPQLVKDVVNAITIDPGQPPEEAEFAVRLRAKIDDTDYGFYAMSLFDRIPGLAEQTAKGAMVKGFLFSPSVESMQRLMMAGLAPQDLLIKEDYKRNTIAGMDFETVSGEYGIRGECALLSDQPMNRADFTLVRKNMVSAGIGLDHTMQNDVYFNIQVVSDLILEYEPLFETEKLAHQFVLNMTRDFMLGDLHMGLRTLYRATYKDWMVSPMFTYKLGQGLEVESGVFMFGGDPWTLFGRFDTKDLAYVELRYRF